MDRPRELLILVCAALLAVAVAASAASETAEEQSDVQATYIVHVSPAHAPLAAAPAQRGRAYASILRGMLPARLRRPRPRLLYTYAHAATGVAARLTAAQAAHLADAGHEAVLAVLPDEVAELHTTHTPSFLGLKDTNGLLPAAHSASDVVIGVIDTGIYPDGRASFSSAESLPAPPSSFRGGCVSSPSFNASAYCNNKLVGAKAFHKGFQAASGYSFGASDELSPLDTNGHGTHCAAIAAGAAVPDASFYGYAAGTAVGMAPSARIAAYKVCWGGCANSDILAGLDAAVADGVDIISMSIGSGYPPPEFYKDSIAIGTFGAVRNGILVSTSAGNSGPAASTVNNVAPWMLTVGASTVNREFPADVVLGNGNTLTGASLYTGEPLSSTQIPLVSGEEAGSTSCEPGWLFKAKVAGKIVVCRKQQNTDQFMSGVAISQAGGAGAIFINTKDKGEEILPAAHILPATVVSYAVGDAIFEYMKSDTSPTATIAFRGTVIGGGSPASPKIASFSSRGPSYRSPEVLKPDVVAPGVSILSAWPGEVSPTETTTDDRRVEFNIQSGTSMACPHVSGVAALLHQARPEWSPAAIKSAIMTTTYNEDSAGETIVDVVTGEESTLFARGAGHVDPNRALDPGLVYDAGADDYIGYLCSRRYTPTQIALFTRDGTYADCSRHSRSAGDLNYPSFSVTFTYFDKVFTHRRVARNVGASAAAVYEVSVSSPAGVDVTVSPSKLVFDEEHQSLAYEVTFAKKDKVDVAASAAPKHASGSIVWSDGVHRVASPVAVTFSDFLVSSI